MVVRMIRWPWPPVIARKFQVRLVVRGIASAAPPPPESAGRMATEVRWKGRKMRALSSLRRTVKRNNTKEEVVSGDYGEVEWNEEFETVVRLTAHKEGAFHPWEIEFFVFHGAKQVFKNRASIVGMASLNLSEYASASGEELELNLPLLMASADTDSRLILHLTLKLLELSTCQESPETLQRSMFPVPLPPSPDNAPPEKDELSALKAGLRKVKIFTEFVSTRKTKKTFLQDESSDGRYSAGSEDADCAYPFDTDSLDDNPDEKLEDGSDETSIRKSFSYGTLATANYVDGAFYFDMKINGKYEDWVYYSHPRPYGAHSHVEDATSASEQYIVQTTKRSIFPWRKRKYSFRSPKAKGEPLLKKAYGEEGGDDIDYDRRQLSSSDESLPAMRCKADDHGSAHVSSISDFGDDNFSVGSWESKEIISRDRLMKLSTTVFFASIDQRSEKAAGQSACTALVAIFADWFKSNHEMMPIKSQFDSLIREGSLQWRNMCEDKTYRERFPDKHFDLETVLQAKIRPLSVIPEKSFIGFFHPEGCKDNSGFEFLHGAMSLDNIWDEITQAGSDCLYIVSWNDHFFVLKVEKDAYFIIDTLGERLYEGCDQAYILKFDERTTIHRLPNQKEKKTNSKEENNGGEEGKQATDAEEELVCRGKESCKEYIKSFLAAIPIRELQADIKKGLIGSTPLHRRLQIEFHYTEAAKNMDNLAETLPLPISWTTERLPLTGPS